jgi:cytoskeletal protein CcmA (bactofilin family)
MWNIRPIQTPSNSPAPEVVNRERVEPITFAAASADSQSSIGKGWVIKGEITGTEPLFIDGCVEGTINLPGGLVTLGRNGQVTASISAGDIVVLGNCSGDITASNRLEVRAQGIVTGNITASRLSIEDGAYLRSSVNIAHDESNLAATTGKTHLVAPQKVAKLRAEPLPMTA